MTFLNNIQSTPSDGPNVDGFGRQRVSQPFTQFDGKTLNDPQPLKYDDAEVSGSGTSSTFNANQASVTIGVSNLTPGKRVRQSFQRMNYLPGKSHLILMTFVPGVPTTGITKAAGYFTDKNGIFLRSTPTAVEVVRRTSVSGSPVDTSVQQSNWNLDKMDGSGPSGVTLDFSKAQLVVFDFEWLGVGRVRVGFNISGRTIYCHEFLNANSLDTVWTSSPNLPIRYEIENDGTGAADGMTVMCATAMSEGGFNRIGLTRGFVTELTDTLNPGNEYGVFGIRLKANYIDQAIVVPEVFSVIGSTSGDAFALIAYKNPTVAGTVNWVGEPNSGVEVFEGGPTNTVTGGTNLGGLVGFSRSTLAGLSSEISAQLGAAIDGTPTEAIFAIKPYSNIKVAIGITWRELS